MKKILSLVLALCLAMGIMSFASAESAATTLDQIVLGENTDLTAEITSDRPGRRRRQTGGLCEGIQRNVS